MAGTFTQLYIHSVFAVKGRENIISSKWNKELFQYVAGTFKALEQKPIIVNGGKDHIHCLFGLKAKSPISDIIRDVKISSSKFVNQKRFLPGKFAWQEGYGAFTISHSNLTAVYDYILNQEKHHVRKSFQEEYLEILKRNEIDFDEAYLFDWY